MRHFCRSFISKTRRRESKKVIYAQGRIYDRGKLFFGVSLLLLFPWEEQRDRERRSRRKDHFRKVPSTQPLVKVEEEEEIEGRKLKL